MPPEDQSIEFSVSDPAEIGALHDRFRQVPGVTVTRIAGRSANGELGVLDVLQAVGGGSGLAALLALIPAYLRARRTGMRLKVKTKGKEIDLTLTNVDEYMPILKKLLDD